MLCPQECFVHEEGANSGVLFLLVFCYVNQPSMFFCASLHMVLAFSYSLAGNRDLLWTDVALKCGELALSSECDLSRVVFLTSFLCSQMWCQIAFSLTCVDQIVGSSVSFLTCTLLVTIARIRVSLGRRLWANSCSPLWGVPPSYLCWICVDSPVTEGSDFLSVACLFANLCRRRLQRILRWLSNIFVYCQNGSSVEVHVTAGVWTRQDLSNGCWKKNWLIFFKWVETTN